MKKLHKTKKKSKFPDLTGDGKVTFADIIKARKGDTEDGRGILKKTKGGKLG